MAKRKTSKRARARPSAPPARSGNPAKRPVEQRPPVTLGDWIAAARPRTLPLAIAPVLVGTGAARLGEPRFHWVIALACLAVAACLQIGVNFTNDYSDGVRGTDARRVGPARLTASGRVSAKSVLITGLAFFGLAALAGLGIVIRTQQWWLLAVGVVCILAAWFYTGGKRPYGYNALGEVFVFVFFGLVATLGTTWVQSRNLPQEAWFGAVVMGMFACAVLLANNLRDIDQDRLVGKRTLTVLIGRRATQSLYTLLVLLPFPVLVLLAVFYPIAWIGFLALLAFLPALVIVWAHREAKELVIALALTSLGTLAYAAVLFWAFVSPTV